MENKTDMSRRCFVQVAATAPALLAGVPTEAAGAGETPFGDAIALWHMGDSRTAQADIWIQGDVRLGVSLSGEERTASLHRGGDAKVAEFRGGHLTMGQGRTLDLSGKKQMSLCLRLRDPGGRWETPLLSIADPHHKLPGILYSASANRYSLNYTVSRRLPRGTALEFLWRTGPLQQHIHPEFFKYEMAKQYLGTPDFMAGVLRLQVPMEMVGAGEWHDLIVRFRGANLEMFLDGVLVDEEWPYGALDQLHGPFLLGAGYQEGRLLSGFHGQVDHLALWDRALSDEEISTLSGGKEEIARKAFAFFGPDVARIQYWRPRGFNTYAGDCMPEYYDDEFHLHYLFDRRHHRSKWGMGAHQFAHASSKDLVHWTHHPMTVKITEQWECSIGTGDVFPQQGKYHAYYIQHQRRCWFKDAPTQGDTINEATSTDGLHFEKNLKPLVAWTYKRRKDGRIGDINPDVFRPDPAGNTYYMSLSGENLFFSDDLDKWSEAETWKKGDGFDLYQDIGTEICGSYFQWNGWYYFTASGAYRFSRLPFQPGWKSIQPQYSALHDGAAGKVAPFNGKRYLMVSTIGGPPPPFADSGPGGYSGDLVFRELVQHEDGTLGTKWPAEMIPATGAPLPLAFMALCGDVSYNQDAIRLRAPASFSAGMFIHAPQDTLIRLNVKPAAGTSSFGLCLRGEGAYERGCELRFDPRLQRVQYGTPENGGLAPEAGAGGRHGNSIRGVTGIDRSFHLDVVVKENFIDACVDNRRTIISRRVDRPTGDRLFFFVNEGEVIFDNITVAELA